MINYCVVSFRCSFICYIFANQGKNDPLGGEQKLGSQDGKVDKVPERQRPSKRIAVEKTELSQTTLCQVSVSITSDSLKGKKIH